MSLDAQRDSLGLFREVRRRLPLRKESLVQQGRGLLQTSAIVVSGSEAAFYHAYVGTKSNSLAELNSDYTGFVLPLSWRQDFYLNGKQVDAKSIYMPVDDTMFLARGWERETVAVALARDEFVATIAALQGVDPANVKLDSGSIEVPQSAAAFARKSIAELLDTYRNRERVEGASTLSDEALTTRVMTILTDLYLQGSPNEKREIRQRAKLGRIVRRAEEYFEAAKFKPISIADLCVAAKVSQGTLNHAFNEMCGASPMTHFKNRRLTDARLALLSAISRRGAVKSAALSQGLSHLGRFSQEYHNLFGEYPRATLTRD